MAFTTINKSTSFQSQLLWTGTGATNASALAIGGNTSPSAVTAVSEEWTIGQNVKVITD